MFNKWDAPHHTLSILLQPQIWSEGSLKDGLQVSFIVTSSNIQHLFLTGMNSEKKDAP